MTSKKDEGGSGRKMSFVGYDHIKDDIDNPEPQVDCPSVELSMGSTVAGAIGDRYVLALVGLPASGKTFVSRRLCQYLTFFHSSVVKSFNVGDYRRELFGLKSNHQFFDHSNKTDNQKRLQCAEAAMKDLKVWLQEGDGRGRVAIYDATNSTRERRAWILDQLSGIIESKRKLIFVESIVRLPDLVENNVLETKLTSPDYEGMKPDEIVNDFKKRIEHYRKVYQPLDEEVDENLTWIKLIDSGRHISMNNISGFLPGRIVQFLMNLHTYPREIYLSRHGQSNYNKLGKIGGDSALSESGEQYAIELARWVHTEILGLNEDGTFPDSNKKVATRARLFTSSLRRTKMTARHIVHNECDDGWVTMRPKVCPALDEIYAGEFDGFTYAQIKEKAPKEFQKRKDNKLTYRYPRGESYLDVIGRLDPIIHELERQRDPVLVVGHQGILRILYSYFVGESRENAPFVSIPLNTIIKLEPHTYSCNVSRINLNKSHGESDEPPSH